MNRVALVHRTRDDLIGLILAQHAQIGALIARIAELEAKLANPPKTPENSGLPPSKGQKPNLPDSGKKKPRPGPPAWPGRLSNTRTTPSKPCSPLVRIATTRSTWPT